MSKDFSEILQEIDRKLSRPTIEFIYRTAQEHQPRAKAILDGALFNAGSGDPAGAFRSFMGEVINTSFAAGFVLGATDTTDEMRELIKEWQQEGKGLLEIQEKDPAEGLAGQEILAEIPGSGIVKD
jgi:hypothetical protein